jgi:hypothetical protein
MLFDIEPIPLTNILYCLLCHYHKNKHPDDKDLNFCIQRTRYILDTQKNYYLKKFFLWYWGLNSGPTP